MDELYKDYPRPITFASPRTQYISGYTLMILMTIFDPTTRAAFLNIWVMGWPWNWFGVALILFGMLFFIPLIWILLQFYVALPAMHGVAFIESITTKRGRAPVETFDENLGGVISAYLEFFETLFINKKG